MRIIVDAMGGDNAPAEIIKGCRMAVDEYKTDILLTGNEKVIRDCADKNGISLDGMEIRNADDVISMDDDPKKILREKKGCSMAVGLELLAAGDGDAMVSAGSTGALMMGATFIAGRIKGIRRAALASIMPTASTPFMLLDAGANAECQPEHLAQFAMMGSIYMNRLMRSDKPRIGLANIGTEDTKGDTLRKETFALLKKSGLNFIGNIEARDIPAGCCEVVVADGFTGNIILKMYEGVAGMMLKRIKDIYTSSTAAKLSFLAVRKGFKQLKKDMDYTDYGGAPILGVRKTVIKAHGAADAKTVKNAVRQAKECIVNRVAETIAENITE